MACALIAVGVAMMASAVQASGGEYGKGIGLALGNPRRLARPE